MGNCCLAMMTAVGPDRQFAVVQCRVRYEGSSGLEMLTVSLSHLGRVGMWRGGGRLNMSVFRLFRLAVP